MDMKKVRSEVYTHTGKPINIYNTQKKNIAAIRKKSSNKSSIFILKKQTRKKHNVRAQAYKRIADRVHLGKIMEKIVKNVIAKEKKGLLRYSTTAQN